MSIAQKSVHFWKKEGKGLPLLMLHGHGGDHRGLVQLGKALSGPVIIVDLPGFGTSSELSDHSIKSYVGRLMQFMDEQDIDGYYLLGHSLGSAIALALAAQDVRVKKLIMVDPVPEFTRTIRRLVKLMRDTAVRLPAKTSEALIHADLYNLGTFLLHSTRRRDITHAKNYLLAQKTTTYSLRAWRESGEAIYEMNQAELARDVTASTLLIHGDKDKMTTLTAIERFAENFAHVTLRRIGAAGHFIPLENVTEASKLINEFLS